MEMASAREMVSLGRVETQVPIVKKKVEMVESTLLLILSQRLEEALSVGEAECADAASWLPVIVARGSVRYHYLAAGSAVCCIASAVLLLRRLVVLGCVVVAFASSSGA